MCSHPAQFPQHIFRAYDIRGKLSHLTPAVVAAIAQALALQFKQAKQTQVVIGYDARFTSPGYAQIIAQVFQQHGLQTTEIGCCSTPMMYYMARQHQGNGVMVTASHNPKSDNGIKWMVQGLPPSPQQIQTVGQLSQQYYQPEQHLLAEQTEIEAEDTTQQYCQQYLQTLLQDIQLHRGFKVVVDAMHGSAGPCAVKVLQQLGCEVVALHCQPDGHFHEHAPDPSQAAHLTQLVSSVIAEKADLGIALDGDGDRLVVVDEHGQIICADRLIALFAKICLAAQPEQEIVVDVKCSTMVLNTIKRLQGTPAMIRTGSTFLRQYLHDSQGKAIFGGEYAGHYVFNDGRGFGYDDGLYAALRILEHLSQVQQPLSQVLAEFPERCATEDTYISTCHLDPNQVLDELEAKSSPFAVEVHKIDGVRLDFNDGFGIMRASNTGEYFTVRFDADSPQRLDEIRHFFVSMLQEKYPKIATEILAVQ